MHEGGEQPLFEIGQMQCRKFLASLEPVFVNCTLVLTQEMTGHAVHDHHPVTAFFEVLFIKNFPGLLEVLR